MPPVIIKSWSKSRTGCPAFPVVERPDGARVAQGGASAPAAIDEAALGEHVRAPAAHRRGELTVRHVAAGTSGRVRKNSPFLLCGPSDRRIPGSPAGVVRSWP
jgi:hypothetical protein